MRYSNLTRRLRKLSKPGAPVAMFEHSWGVFVGGDFDTLCAELGAPTRDGSTDYFYWNVGGVKVVTRKSDPLEVACG